MPSIEGINFLFMDDYEQRVQFIFSRFDKYLEVVTAKGTVYLAINTFFISCVIGNISTLSNAFNVTELVIFLLSMFLTIALISTFIVLLAINPFLKSGTKIGASASIFFYGSVAEYDKEVFMKRLSGISKEELEQDLGGQIYCLAEGLKSKYLKLQWAGWLILAEFLLLIPITIVLVAHIKT